MAKSPNSYNGWGHITFPTFYAGFKKPTVQHLPRHWKRIPKQTYPLIVKIINVLRVDLTRMTLEMGLIYSDFFYIL